MKRGEIVQLNLLLEQVHISGPQIPSETFDRVLRWKLSLEKAVEEFREYTDKAREQSRPEGVQDLESADERQRTEWESAFSGAMGHYMESDYRIEVPALNRDDLNALTARNELTAGQITFLMRVLMKPGTETY